MTGYLDLCNINKQNHLFSQKNVNGKYCVYWNWQKKARMAKDFGAAIPGIG